MTVGILTFFGGTNFGTVLQAYALYKYVEQLGHQPTIIKYYDAAPQKLPFMKRFSFSKVVEKLETKLEMQRSKSVVSKLHQERRDCFSQFRLTEFSQTEKVYRRSDIHEIADQFDCYLCGSDQIWTPFAGYCDPTYWLDFVPDGKKKISYAASMANCNFSEDGINHIRDLAVRMQFLSVRERIGLDFLNSLGLNNCRLVCDPTLLHDVAYWEKFIADGIPKGMPSQKYALAVFLGDNGVHRKIAKEYAVEHGLELVTYPFAHKISHADINFGDHQITACSPQEFLCLIKNAACIITDSYHISLFSFVFHKEIYILTKHKDNDKDSQNARIYDLLDMFHAKDRVLESKLQKSSWNSCKKLDFDWIDEKILSVRIDSAQYLKAALEEADYGEYQFD